jgi:murein DD-endopeptidase MepM/ murein hydrolase activator NlpD
VPQPRRPTPRRDAAAFILAASALAWRERPHAPRAALALALAAAFAASGWLRPVTPLATGIEFGFALPAADEDEAADPRLAELERRLESSEQERLRLRSEFERLAESSARQIARQGAAIDELAEHATASVDALGRLIARTGVDPERLMANVARERGLGGPLVALADDGRIDAAAPALARLQALRRGLGALPLEAPLAAFDLISPHGVRRDPFDGQPAMHLGADLAAPLRSPVLAAARGTVSFAGWNGDYGQMVEIDHGVGLKTRYGHLARIEVRAGDALPPRALVGLLGSTGRSTGPHLHYEVQFEGRSLDPMRFIEARRLALRREGVRRGG